MKIKINTNIGNMKFRIYKEYLKMALMLSYFFKLANDKVKGC